VGLIDPADRKELEDEFDHTRRQHVNVCPGFRLSCRWDKDSALSYDDAGQLTDEVAARTRTALKTWNQDLPT